MPLALPRASRYNPGVADPFPAAIRGTTRCCAVFGHPVRHSASPAFQNAGLAALGLDWRYLALDVPPEDLSAAIAGARAMRFIGVNLTVPHKRRAVPLVDFLDESARRWDAVNTIRFEGQNATGEWQPLRQFAAASPRPVRAHGFNTDADALIRSLAEDLSMSVPGASVVVLGAGGAGRTAALKLADAKVAQLFLVNRTASKAAALAAEIRQRFPDVCVQVGHPRQPVDLLLNATSLGLEAGDPLPLDERQFPLREARMVYDMIYRPAETSLLQRARANGCRVANGVGMLLYQGAAALELWTGQAAPLQPMRAALEQDLNDQQFRIPKS